MKLNKPKFWDLKSFSFLPILFLPITIIYSLLFSLKKKIEVEKKFSIPIICVGNIYIGGTGKTPLSSEIYKIIKSMGKNPAFVKKNYIYLEDEIKMLEKVGTTFVSKKRNIAIQSLINNMNNVAILDDGFQDFSVYKNFSIVCFNQKQWQGNGYTIPSGPLRENMSSIKRADCIFINGNKDIEIENSINNYKKIKIFYSYYKPNNIVEFKNKNIIAFAGIGNPNNFFDLLVEHKLNLVDKITFPDHFDYKEKDIILLKSKADESDAILLTTEKDYMRLNDKFKTNINYLKVDLEIKNKNEFIDLLKKKL